MAEQIKFLFDPGCPWCYVTSKWAKRLEELGEIELSWGLFSLEVVNSEKPDEVTELTGRSAAALRTAVAVRNVMGEKAVGKFYSAIGNRFWDGTEGLNSPDMLKGALTDIGADPSLYDQALADDSTTKTILEEHRAAIAKHGVFGVPSIILDNGEGLQFFGPVLRDLPSDEDSKKLLEHVIWLTGYEDFYELKRNRTGMAELEAIKRFRAMREQQQREQAAQQAKTS
jgi:2-hydroxychromene-2-carboxylate isomerase